MLAATLGAACISCSAILVTLAGTAAATTAFFRCLLALPVLAVLALIEQRRHGRRRGQGPARARCVAGLLLAVDLVLWNHAIAEVGAGIATVLGNLQLAFVAGAAWLLFGERPGRRFLFVLPVVMAGVVLVSGLADGGGVRHHALAGIIYGIGTSVAYAGVPAHLAAYLDRHRARGRAAGRRHGRRGARRAGAGPAVRRLAPCTSAGRRSAGCCCWPPAARPSAGC